MIWSYLYFYNS